MQLKTETYGMLSDGTVITCYTLANAGGMRVRLIDFGGIVVSIEAPDRKGRLADITLGYDRLEGYLKNDPYFGAMIGRYCNRIAKGRFVLDGKEYRLAQNNGENHLHGGPKGFHKVVWSGEPFQKEGKAGVIFSYLSRDGEEGYPGNLDCRVVYTLTDRSELKLLYRAVTDQPTPVGLTHHSYFNLAGQGIGDVLAHELVLNADHYTPVNDSLIPTGEIAPVRGTPMDFTAPVAISARIGEVAGGYDHNYVLNKTGAGPEPAAKVTEPVSGRVMEVRTTAPGMQFYTGNFLDGTVIGKGGKPCRKHSGFCLEAQPFPDSPNQPRFPSVVLNPGETYEQETVYTFSTL